MPIRGIKIMKWVGGKEGCEAPGGWSALDVPGARDFSLVVSLSGNNMPWIMHMRLGVWVDGLVGLVAP